MNRRTFITTGTAWASAPVLLKIAENITCADVLSPVAEPPKVGSQLYGWGQYYQREGKALGDHLDEVLSALRDAGYDYAEGNLDINRPENNEAFAQRLKDKGLEPVSLYCGGNLHESGVGEETVDRLVESAEVARRAGFRVLNCNPNPIGREKTHDELEIQSMNLTQLGKALKGLGMEFGIHHHTPAMNSNAREFHANFKLTEPKWVGFCYDVHWVFRGGMEPSKALTAYGNRVVSWHLRQSRNGIWWEDLAEGDIDYAYIAEHVRTKNLPEFFTVELALESGTQVTRTAVENHRRSREFVKKIFQV